MKSPALIGALLASFAVSASAASFTDYANVRSVEPQYERFSTPRKECTREVVEETRRTGNASSGERDYGGAIIGGIAGALLGNQVGKGHGREAATAAGAVVGALAGDNLANRNNQGNAASGETYETIPREIQRCRTVDDWQQRLTGYRVQYEYGGQTYSTVLPHDPGRRLRVTVSVDPAP